MTMSELRGDRPSVTNDFYSANTQLGSKLSVLLASLPESTRNAIVALSAAPPETRAEVLDSLDSETRNSLNTILSLMG